MLSNYAAEEVSWEPLGLQRDQTSQSHRKPTLNIYGKADAKAEAQLLWLPEAKSPLTGKDPGAGKDWRQKEKRAPEDEMVR